MIIYVLTYSNERKAHTVKSLDDYCLDNATGLGPRDGHAIAYGPEQAMRQLAAKQQGYMDLRTARPVRSEVAA